MSRSALVLAVLLLQAAFAQAPAYTADQIVNSSDYSPGPFAPNSVLSIFGTNLSWYTYALKPGDIAAGTVPVELAGVAVYVDNWPAPLLYVSPSQINFLVPDNEIGGNVTVYVTREGTLGSVVTVTLQDAAPALFDGAAGYAIATHADGSLLTDASPAQPGETVVLYATGLGPTSPNFDPGDIPQFGASIANLSSFSVSLNGAVLPAGSILYAGVTPFTVGLYQINLRLPPDVGPDPAIQIAVGAAADSDGLKLPVQPAPAGQL